MRGASAANLARFGADFAPSGAAATYDLSTSWRNPVVVLEAANTLIAPLDAGIPKAPLRPSPFAGPGRLDVTWHETIDDEAGAVAEWFARLVDARHRIAGPTPVFPRLDAPAEEAA